MSDTEQPEVPSLFPNYEREELDIHEEQDEPESPQEQPEEED